MAETDPTRRDVLETSLAACVVAMTGTATASCASHVAQPSSPPPAAERDADVSLTINGVAHTLRQLPVATTLLDALRDHLHLTGTKKGCGLGHCGACTVLVEGRRVSSCLALAVMQQGKTITTIEGLASGDELHPLQAAFIEHDGFQCGYCTPGQIMGGVACIAEGHAGSDDEIREWMSGNICRCGAYSNIVAAIRKVARGGS